MHRLIAQLDRFSRVSWKDLGIFLLTVFFIVNLLGSLGLAGSMIYTRVITGHWLLPW